MPLSLLLLYYVSLLAVFLFLLGSCIYLATMLYSAAYKIPMVGTRKASFRKILDSASLNDGHNKRFVDLGSGDGRNVLEAAKLGYDATGYEVNPMLVFLSNLKKRFLPATTAQKTHFIRGNLLSADLTQTNVIYLFLFPFMLELLVPKLISEAESGTIIISHGFLIPSFPHKPYRTLQGKPFSTYYYRV